jgi:hypothetical protein
MSDIELLAFGFCTAFFVVVLKSIVQTLVESWSKKEWVGLTGDEIEASKPPLSNDAVVWELAVEWAEAKLKERNT